MRRRTIWLAAGFIGILLPSLRVSGEESHGMIADKTGVTIGSRTLPIAPLGPPNLWPRFRFQLRDEPIVAAESLSAEDRAGMFRSVAVSPLPYLVQENYTRRRQPGALPTILVENAALRATFYPSLGGRMISLYDKHAQRELLFDNPVLQFANLAARNAWFSGGVEWNGPPYGHSLLTCSPVFAAVVETPRGPLLRLYEFERVTETTWQVDVFLPAGDDRLWLHVKAINPNAHEIPFYWWTNIAVPLTGKTRVLSPLDYALDHLAAGNAHTPFPIFEGRDGSYPINYSCAKSVFFRKPGSQRPWLACVDGQGRGISHVSTPTLFGRKLFTWGTGRGGKHWMDYLSAEGRGDYIEIQGGVTPTQLQTRPLPAAASIEWTECISPLTMDVQAAHLPDYSAACAAAALAVERRVPPAMLREVHAFLLVAADAPVRTVLHRGSGWGALEEQRSGKRLSPGLAFASEPTADERPWAELLSTGRFSEESLNDRPASFNVSPGWVAVLRASAVAHGATWLHHVHLGVAQLQGGDWDGARAELKASLGLRQNALAHRCLALLDEHDGHLDEAQAAYHRAWALCGGDANLAVEICDFLIRHRRHAALDAMFKSLPPPLAEHERIVLIKAQVALARGDDPLVRKLLRREFCTIREGEVGPSDLWFASYVQEAESRKGRALTSGEKEEFMQEFPPPREIDFRMR
jgi:hypothetical protein